MPTTGLLLGRRARAGRTEEGWRAGSDGGPGGRARVRCPPWGGAVSTARAHASPHSQDRAFLRGPHGGAGQLIGDAVAPRHARTADETRHMACGVCCSRHRHERHTPPRASTGRRWRRGRLPHRRPRAPARDAWKAVSPGGREPAAASFVCPTPSTGLPAPTGKPQARVGHAVVTRVTIATGPQSEDRRAGLAQPLGSAMAGSRRVRSGWRGPDRGAPWRPQPQAAAPSLDRLGAQHI